MEINYVSERAYAKEGSQALDNLMQNFGSQVLTPNQMGLLNGVKGVANLALGNEDKSDVLADAVEVFLSGMIQSVAMQVDANFIKEGIEAAVEQLTGKNTEKSC